MKLRKLGALILTGALCATLTLPALAAEMTLPLGKDGEKVILSDVASTETKTAYFWNYSEDGTRTKKPKEITVYHLAPGCIADLLSCDFPGREYYNLSEGAYDSHGEGQNSRKFILESNPGEMVKLLGYYTDTEGVFCMPATHIAIATPQTVLLDGKEAKLNAYALKDADGNMTNYFKVRDVASVLSGTAAQFSVDWKDQVLLKTKTAYTPNGSEMTTPFTGDQPYYGGRYDSTAVDDSSYQLDYITIIDAKGGAYTYYKLRDLGDALGFTVDWNGKNITIDTAATKEN